MRLFLAACLLAAPALAQVQLFQWNGTAETPVGSIYQLAPVSPGDAPTVEFHLRNTGTGAATFQTLSVAGANFKIVATQTLPFVIAPGAYAGFIVGFSPDAVGSYSASLQVNSIAVILRGSAVAAASLQLGGATLTAGATVDFGKIEQGTTAAQSFTLSNPSASPLTVSSVKVSGTGFQGPTGISSPLTLSPGQSIPFQIVFAPSLGGTFAGTLAIDQRTFNLTGVGLVPALPSASITLAAPNAASAQQMSIGVKLSAASKIPSTGTLIMEFHPAVAGVADDPAVQFLSGPTRAATVTIQAGDSIARFGAATQLQFQTGTTAGTILFTLTLPNSTSQSSLTVAPSSPGIDLSTGVLRTSDLDIGLAGFDNTRTLSQLAFTFYDRTGKLLAPGRITTDVTNSFAALYKTSPAGGSFALRATFPIIGDPTKVGGVNVEVMNQAGVTKLQRISF